MAKSAFTEELLPTLSNHHGAIQEPMDGTNKDVTGARLLPTTVSTCPVDSVPHSRHSIAVCVLMEALTRLQLPTRPLPPTHPL